ncbi:MAG TPA: hypothetical protein HA263_00390 [Methanoregulaceae archaeon]|nr:hypothetical protein [Methanoregulaceae archaeon]
MSYPPKTRIASVSLLSARGPRRRASPICSLGADYDQRRFPGPVYRGISPNCAVLVFTSGK